MPAAFTMDLESDQNPHAEPGDRLHGVMAPVVTPLDASRQLDLGSLDRLVVRLLDAGVHGLWVNGTTGEFYGLDPDQREQVVGRCAATSAGSVPVIAHVGDSSSALAVVHAQRAKRAGARWISVLAPYVVGFSQDEIKDHFRRLADAVGDPVIAYHMPQIIDPGPTVDSLLDLAAEGVVCGVKDSSSDVLWLRALIEADAGAAQQLPCFTGGSAVSDLGYFIGAAGAMSSTTNLVPRHLVAQYRAARRGDWDEVRTRQRQTDELMAALRLPGRHTPSAMAGSYKSVLTALGMLRGEWGVEPLRDLTEPEQEQLAATVVPMIEKLEGVQQPV